MHLNGRWPDWRSGVSRKACPSSNLGSSDGLNKVLKDSMSAATDTLP